VAVAATRRVPKSVGQCKFGFSDRKDWWMG
jgi:hypothetical protein